MRGSEQRGTWVDRNRSDGGFTQLTLPPQGKAVHQANRGTAGFLPADFGKGEKPNPFGAQGNKALREFSDLAELTSTVRASAAPAASSSATSAQWLLVHSLPPSATMLVVSFLDVCFGDVEAYYFALEHSPMANATTARRGVLYVAMRSEFAAQRIVMHGSLVIPLPRGTSASESGEGALRISAAWAAAQQVPPGAEAQLARKRSPLSSSVRTEKGNAGVEHVFAASATPLNRVLRQVWPRSQPQLTAVSVTAALPEGILATRVAPPPPQGSRAGGEAPLVVLRATPLYLSYNLWSSLLLFAILYVLCRIV